MAALKVNQGSNQVGATVGFILLLFGAAIGSSAEVNLVANGSFEKHSEASTVPADWSPAGNSAIQQRLILDRGRDGQFCAELDCFAFAGDGPDFHAMLCQVGKVELRQGHWYRLVFWAKGEGIRVGAVDVALTNTRHWRNAGLAEVFTPGKEWRRFEFAFRAREDLPAALSRLQFWFKSTGKLWLDDVVLTETEGGPEWFPQISTDGAKNFVPNSSFECGAANWGSFSYGLSGWGGNLYRLVGEPDTAVAKHGHASLRISLSSATLPVRYLDYYEPVCQAVRRVLAANRGWFKVQSGQVLTLSAYLKADAEGVPAQMAINEAPDHLSHKRITVGKEWQRFEFTFAPSAPFLFVAIGPDLEPSQRDSVTVWLDAIQLERGDHATPYEPRSPVEFCLETALPGNIFTNPSAGLAFRLRGFNDTAEARTVSGEFQLTDFFDRPVYRARPELSLPPHAAAQFDLADLCPGTNGYYRATWTTATSTQAVRCALIEPAAPNAADYPLGFNHAFPWDFLVELAHEAGVCWWRDWSAKWQTVEPEPGRFAFATADTQIRRVLALHGQVDVLLPFPSASWSTTARPDQVDKAAGGNSYLRARLPLAYAPKDLADFDRYAAQVAAHYGNERARAVTYFEVLNEPIFTDYALPEAFGYSVGDYLRLLEGAQSAMKAANPACRIVGGIGNSAEALITRDFVAKGGLRFVDVFDVHMYDPPRPAENFEDSFRSLEVLMSRNGGPKPIWITEWGCYADDDPACLPPTVGDETMNRCRWPDERSASEHIVKFTAVAFAHGARKVFFHAGTCGAINGPDAGGVLFEYGGAPRKMYAAAAALTRLLGTPDECVKYLNRADLKAYVFRDGNRFVAVAWRPAGQDTPSLGRLSSRVQVFDIMGNAIPARDARLGESPLYLVAPDAGEIVNSLSGQP